MISQQLRSQIAATVSIVLCVLVAGCRHTAPAAKPVLTSEALAPSPRLIVGRILAIDAERGFAFVELGYDSPAAALAEGSELIARTLELQETARLRASRYVRGRTLGTRIMAGKPRIGDEVVWTAP